MTRVLTALVAAGLLVYASPVHAQRGRYRDVGTPPEYGIDAAATFTLDPSATAVSIPAARLRAGFFASHLLEFEPNLGFVSANGSGNRFTQLEFGLGALYHFARSRFETQPYLRPFAALQFVSATGESTSTSPAAGIGFGAKFPFGARFAFRPELNYAHVWTDGDADDLDQIQLLLGISVYGH
ncbi:MAG: hypothetical protein DMD35_04370 [Gemmatimonadetes bacterium]|nr:MAG: hypothetical protein DMD35_04370 [Gemmatimonadota bacterium]